MIDVKQAIEVAKQNASEMLGSAELRLEEIEREDYHGRDVWSITLSLPDERRGSIPLIAVPLQYKRFLVDAETGVLLAMKLREVA